MSIDEFYIRWLCNVLRGMTLSEYFGDTAALKFSERFFRYSYPIVVFLMILFVGCVVATAFSGEKGSSVLKPLMGWIFVLLFISMILYGLIVFIEIFRKSWVFYKKRYDSFLDIFEWHSTRDRNFLRILNKFEVSTLEFALIQYCRQWTILRWKMYFWLVLVLPIFAFDLVDAIAVKPPIEADLDVGIIKSSIFFLSSFVFYIIWLRQRPKHVIILLEYVIRLKSDPQKHVSKLSAEPPFDLRERLGRIFK